MTFDALAHRSLFAQPHRCTDVESWHQHIPFAFLIAELQAPDVLVELGVHKGDSYCAFCQAVAEHSLPTRCYGVDSWEGDEHSGPYPTEVYDELKAYHDPRYGDFSRLIRASFDESLEQIADGAIDLLHIDGCHTYDAVKHDFESWLPKLSRRAVVLLHDISVREGTFGVGRLWDELSARFPSFDFPHGYGLGVLVVGPEPSPAIEEFLDFASERNVEMHALFFSLGSRVALAARVQRLSARVDELSALHVQWEALRVERDSLREEVAETGGVRSERDALRAERDALRASLSERKEALAAMRHSASWRLTAPFREFASLSGIARVRSRSSANENSSSTSVRGDRPSLSSRSLAPFERVRAELASQWIGGHGIEIGALHQRLAVPDGAAVTYVDRMGLAELRAEYPELAEYALVEPTVIDDGEHLQTFRDDSQDFVIANHFLEHCENPIRALQNALRVLKIGGVLYLAIPDKRLIFDRDRPVTSTGHLDCDYLEGPEWSRTAHYEEWAKLVDHAEDIESRVHQLISQNYSIHFHVWTHDSFSTFLEHCRVRYGFAFEIVAIVQNDFEVIGILKKSPVAYPQDASEST